MSVSFFLIYEEVYVYVGRMVGRYMELSESGTLKSLFPFLSLSFTLSVFLCLSVSLSLSFSFTKKCMCVLVEWLEDTWKSLSQEQEVRESSWAGT